MTRTLSRVLLAVSIALIGVGLTASPAAAVDDPLTTPVSDWTPPDEFPGTPPPPPEGSGGGRGGGGDLLPPQEGCSVRACILSWARFELGQTSRNREAASNCNYYSGWWLTSGTALSSCPTTSSIKWRSNQWCSDFSRYIWSKGGGRTAGLDPWAGSFYRANKTNGRFKALGTYTPQPGDAVVYDWDRLNGGTNGWGIDHVGIVEAYSSGQLTTIEGNTAPNSTSTDGVYRRYRTTYYVVGYIIP